VTEHTYRHHVGRRIQVAAAILLALALLGLTGCGEFAAQCRNSEGVRLYQQSRYQDALTEFQQASYDDPRSADAHYNLAATYHAMGRLGHSQADLSRAEQEYNLCIERNPNHTDCYRGLAVLLAEQGRNDQAFRLIEGWVQQHPESADARIELARLNDEFGRHQVAQEQLIEALVLQPDNSRALTAIGWHREVAGDKAQALANYQRSLLHDNRQPLVAARISALQGGTPPNGAAPAPAAPGTPPPPATDQGTRMADRNVPPPK
jgi:tetratricopeptide (TPR) repeat protein